MSEKRGWRNHYRANMPASERVIKDLRSFAGDVGRGIRNAGKLRTIVTYPDYPSKRTTIYKIARKLGYRLTNKPLKNADIVMLFEDTTLKSTSTDAYLQNANHVLNLKCTDISKVNVEAVHQKIFGYGTFIDPLTFKGKAVEKSDENAKHDGHYITCPIDAVVPNCIYQIILENQDDDGLAVDHRVPVMNGIIPLVWLKIKKWDVRFTNDIYRSELYTPHDLFSEEELALIRKFSAEIHADFCELDIIRHKTDGKIYIVDVNTTPFGPPAGLPDAQHIESVEKLSGAFEAGFIA
jgi:hypothetical protein